MSVSAEHGFIKFDDDLDELIYSDNYSSYGSQILIQKLINLKLDIPIYLQNELSILKVTLKRQSYDICRLFCKCFRNENQASE